MFCLFVCFVFVCLFNPWHPQLLLHLAFFNIPSYYYYYYSNFRIEMTTLSEYFFEISINIIKYK